MVLSRLYALTIGINKYNSSDYSELRGAVHDADAIEDFLKSHLGLSSSRALRLRNEQATRSNILQAFRSLQDNDSITKDDPIVIFFAGHGSRGEKPESWRNWESSSDLVEFICPADMGEPAAADPSSGSVPGIPDRTIAALLHGISASKGNNITLILDCCHAAGMSRSASDVGDAIARVVTNAPPIPDDCDESILAGQSSRSGIVVEGFSGAHHESHVLLAACSRDQFAYEDPRSSGGIFTNALLKLLSQYPISELTYTSLMHKISMPKWQSPQCEGLHVHRRLFDGVGPGADRKMILCWEQQEGTRILDAGAAQGVVVKSKYKTYRTNLDSPDNSPLGILAVTDVQPLFSMLSLPPESKHFELPNIFYAKLAELGPAERFKVYCLDKKWIEDLISYEDEDEMGIELVDTAQDADLILSVTAGEVHFDKHDVLAEAFIGTRLPHTVDVDDTQGVLDVIRCAAQYKDHLMRQGEGLPNVWMEFRELKAIEGLGWLNPFGPNYFAEDPAVVVVDDPSKRYGLTVFNQTDLSLYAYLFYFDPSSLEIIEWFMSPFGSGVENYAAVDEPLPPKSRLTIGFGDGGASPWRFALNPGENVDVGFFKLFLTTGPANFATVYQRTPFVSKGSRHAKLSNVLKKPHIEIWATKMATVVQCCADSDLQLKFRNLRLHPD